jgi:hypothetical protein
LGKIPPSDAAQLVMVMTTQDCFHPKRLFGVLRLS